MPKEILTVAQIGTFDCKNFGDLLFPNVLEWHLKKRRKNVELVLFSPIGGEKPFECGTIVHPICDLENCIGRSILTPLSSAAETSSVWMADGLLRKNMMSMLPRWISG